MKVQCCGPELLMWHLVSYQVLDHWETGLALVQQTLLIVDVLR